MKLTIVICLLVGATAVKLPDNHDQLASEIDEIVADALLESQFAPPGEWSERSAEIKRLRAKAQTSGCSDKSIAVDHTDGCQEECARCDEPNWVNDYCVCKAGPSCKACRQNYCEDRYPGKNFNLEQCARADVHLRQKRGREEPAPVGAKGSALRGCEKITGEGAAKLTAADNASDACTKCGDIKDSGTCSLAWCCHWMGENNMIQSCEDSMGSVLKFTCFPLFSLDSTFSGSSEPLLGSHAFGKKLAKAATPSYLGNAEKVATGYVGAAVEMAGGPSVGS